MTPIRRRLGLVKSDVKYTVRRKLKWRNLPRTLFLVLVLGHDGEFCCDCGWKYELLWWSPKPLWGELMNAGGGGMICPRCYNRRADRAEIRLIWTPMVASRRVNGTTVPTTNWWLSDTRDWLMMGVPDPDCFDRDRDSEWYPTQWTWQQIKELFGDAVPPSLDTWSRQEKPLDRERSA